MPVGAPMAARADVNWTLSNIAFADGGTASGTFTTSDSGLLASWDIVTQDGANVAIYDSAFGSTATGITAASFDIVSGSQDLALAFSSDLTASTYATSGIAPVATGIETFVAGSRAIMAGDAIPEPVSMALFGTSLFGLGAIRLRRRA